MVQHTRSLLGTGSQDLVSARAHSGASYGYTDRGEWAGKRMEGTPHGLTPRGTCDRCHPQIEQ